MTPELEAAKDIREIWRPLFDLSINAEEMAYLIRQCMYETEQILTTSTTQFFEAGKLQGVRMVGSYRVTNELEARNAIKECLNTLKEGNNE